MSRGGVDISWYLAWLAQHSGAADPSRVQDVTLGQIRALFARKVDSRRPPQPAGAPPAVMPYADVLRHVFRQRGEPEEAVEKLVAAELARRGGR